ncbi:baseplate J protein, partial [Paenibacillus melissococcoides]
ILTELLRIKKGRSLNELNHSDIIFAIRKELDVRNVKVNNPPQDVVLDNSKVIVLGEVTVRLMRG